MVRHLFLVSLCVSGMLPSNRQTDHRQLDSIQSVFTLALLSPTRAPPAERDVDLVQRPWTHLHSRLLRLEESWLLPPSEVRPQS